MRKGHILFLVLLGVLASMVAGGGSSAIAMAGTHGKGDPKHPISVSTWPRGLDMVANRTDRIGGYWINASDVFYYSGNAKHFNDFLQQYARVQDRSLTLVIDGSPAWKGGLGPEGGRSDWELDVNGWSQAVASLTLPLGGRIALKDIKVPANIRVYYEGEKTPEVEKFLAAHNALQDKVKDAETDKQPKSGT